MGSISRATKTLEVMDDFVTKIASQGLEEEEEEKVDEEAKDDDDDNEGKNKTQRKRKDLKKNISELTR